MPPSKLVDQLQTLPTDSPLALRSHPKPVAPSIPKVFALPELLEPILWNLSEIDLVVVQRVNSTWRDIIAQAHFQERLFLTAEVRDQNDLGETVRWNPILQIAGGVVDGDRMFVRCNDFCALFLKRVPGPRKAWRSRGGGWRGMHVTQPSSTQICVHRDDVKEGYGRSSHQLDAAGGVTVERLSHIVNEVLTPSWGNCRDDRFAKDPKNRILRVTVRAERY